MKEVQKREAYEKIKLGMIASKETEENPNLITGAKTSVV